jgi:hypothetical protein
VMIAVSNDGFSALLTCGIDVAIGPGTVSGTPTPTGQKEVR